MASPSFDGGLQESKQEDVTRGKLRQAQVPPVTRSMDVSVARCASDGAAALGQESRCPSTSLLLSPSEVDPRVRVAGAEAALNWPAARRCWAKSVLLGLGTLGRRGVETSL